MPPKPPPPLLPGGAHALPVSQACSRLCSQAHAERFPCAAVHLPPDRPRLQQVRRHRHALPGLRRRVFVYAGWDYGALSMAGTYWDPPPPGFYHKPIDGKCKRCNVAGCSKCDHRGICLKCGYTETEGYLQGTFGLNAHKQCVLVSRRTPASRMLPFAWASRSGWMLTGEHIASRPHGNQPVANTLSCAVCGVVC